MKKITVSKSVFDDLVKNNDYLIDLLYKKWQAEGIFDKELKILKRAEKLLIKFKSRRKNV